MREKPVSGLTDTNNNPIHEGDLFDVKKHSNECCNHIIVCEVKKDKISVCGYGLYDVKTGEYISNAIIACYPHNMIKSV